MRKRGQNRFLAIEGLHDYLYYKAEDGSDQDGDRKG